MSAQQIINIAQQHIDRAEMRGSAALCIADAQWCLTHGKPEYAAQRALRSLAYSVGILHPVYEDAARILKQARPASCDDCGAVADRFIGCPDGAEVCQACFDAGRH